MSRHNQQPASDVQAPEVATIPAPSIKVRNGFDTKGKWTNQLMLVEHNVDGKKTATPFLGSSQQIVIRPAGVTQNKARPDSDANESHKYEKSCDSSSNGAWARVAIACRNTYGNEPRLMVLKALENLLDVTLTAKTVKVDATDADALD